jgi:SPP1 gp7 family putative phage head morphogenesis protein
MELRDLIDSGLTSKVIGENFFKYYELVYEYNLKTFENGEKTITEALRFIKKTPKKFLLQSLKSLLDIDLFKEFGYSDIIINQLKNQTFQASAKTMDRVDQSITQILSQGYQEGKGHTEIGKDIQKQFQKLKTYESERISRTEINSAQNLGAYNQLITDKITYQQWWSAEDKRVRDTHSELHGEIVEVGTPFSNGLLYPGDKSGDIKEWINCRCTLIPFIVPLGKMVPAGMTRFREEDLIPIKQMKLINSNEQNKGEFKSLTELDDTQRKIKEERKSIFDRLSTSNNLKEFNKISPNPLTEIQKEQNLRYYEDLGVSRKESLKIEKEIQKISDIDYEEFYGFKNGNVINHTRGGKHQVDIPDGDYDVMFHNHPFTKDSYAGIPSCVGGDMNFFREQLIENTIEHGPGTKLVSGTAYRNERIFIVGKINRYIGNTRADYRNEIKSTSSDVGEAYKKWKFEVEKMQNELDWLNLKRAQNQLSSLDTNKFAEEYQNTMYKSFNRTMKNKRIDIRIYRWVL